MRINEVLVTQIKESQHIQLIKQECSQFIEESCGSPLLKSLPNTYQNFQKVKVRHKKQKTVIGESFNNAFDVQFHKRAIFANGEKSFHLNENDDKFYIFPKDGYRYLYSTEVENSNLDYQLVFDSLCENFNAQKTIDIVTDMLRYNYIDNNLKEGISNGSEIILFDIPFYYAIRADIDYNF